MSIDFDSSFCLLPFAFCKFQLNINIRNSQHNDFIHIMHLFLYYVVVVDETGRRRTEFSCSCSTKLNLT